MCKVGLLEGNESCHHLNRVNDGKGVLGNTTALQHVLEVVLLSQATDNYQFSPGIYLHGKLAVTTVSVGIAAVV